MSPAPVQGPPSSHCSSRNITQSSCPETVPTHRMHSPWLLGDPASVTLGPFGKASAPRATTFPALSPQPRAAVSEEEPFSWWEKMLHQVSPQQLRLQIFQTLLRVAGTQSQECHKGCNWVLQSQDAPERKPVCTGAPTGLWGLSRVRVQEGSCAPSWSGLRPQLQCEPQTCASPRPDLAVAWASHSATHRPALPPHLLMGFEGCAQWGLCGQSSAKCQAKLRQASLCQEGRTTGPQWKKLGQAPKLCQWPAWVMRGFAENFPRLGMGESPQPHGWAGLKGLSPHARQRGTERPQQSAPQGTAPSVAGAACETPASARSGPGCAIPWWRQKGTTPSFPSTVALLPRRLEAGRGGGGKELRVLGSHA